jgi:excisionase family DNA binding protein
MANGERAARGRVWSEETEAWFAKYLAERPPVSDEVRRRTASWLAGSQLDGPVREPLRPAKPRQEARVVSVSETDKLLFSTEEASAKLGISVDWLRRAVREKTIPHVKLGRRVLFSQQHLDQIIDRNTVTPVVTPARRPRGARTKL